jgi:hypothetical protein
VVSALFGLAHTGGWISVPIAAVWALSGLVAHDRGKAPEGRFPWQPLAATAGGWLLGQLVHPEVPANFGLWAIINFVIPFQATAAGDAALRSQLGTELSAPGLDLLREQWPAFIPPVIVLFSLLFQPRLRTRATLTAGLVSLAFLAAGSLVIRRFFELGAPLALLALALVLRERRDRGLPPLLGSWGRMAAGAAVLVSGLWSLGVLRAHERTDGFGLSSPPQAMARWLGEHGKAGERVFTVQWADSAPLLYYAPQLQSLVALDPTFFYAKDPALFQRYVTIASGADPAPAQAIRDRFGARWVTVPYGLYPGVARQLASTPGVQLVYGDLDYAVLDLGR